MAAIAVGMAAAAGAQQAVSPDLEAVEREAQRRKQEYSERLRSSKLVGADEGLAIELADGELIPLGRRGGCLPPVTRGGLVKVDCTVWDGPAYYFDASTRAMVESCSFWFPEPRRCPPKQWPVDVPGCDAALPQSITGTWKLYAVPAAGGFGSVPNGWTMTLTDESITFTIGGFAPVRRAYALLERGERRFALELRDALSATTRIDVELAPCGLFVESERICDAFCENLANEVGVPTAQDIREAAGRISGGQSEESIERMIAAIRESIEQGPRPIFLERSFFAAASAGRALD